MSITLADRRTIMNQSLRRPDIRELLLRDPRAGAERVLARNLPGGTRIDVIEERAEAWEFVVPAGTIDADLPAARDARDVIENDVYALLRDEPEVRAHALSDPKGFLRDRLNIDIGDTGVNAREEAPGAVLVVIPHADSRDELNDDALDLVAGGSNPECVKTDSASRSPEGHT